MKITLQQIGRSAALVLFAGIWLFSPANVFAHCDTMDGPVINAARAALEKGDVTPVLKWVKKDDEPAIQEAFKKTIIVRAKGPEARELADRSFFETLVRIHRAGEGAPYTGIEPAGADLGPAVTGADKALETGSVDGLTRLITDEVARGIRERFARTLEKKKHADESVAAGREFVESYVDYVHYIEGLDKYAAASAAHHGHHTMEKKEAAAGHHHE